MKNGHFASNLILFFFLILVAMTAFFSDLFQNKIKTTSQIIEQAKLFPDNEINNMNRLLLKNKTGNYTFERDLKQSNSPWHMTSPQNLSTESIFIDKLFKSLVTIKIKKIFPDEKINASNFSTDKSTTSLTCTGQDGKITHLQFGLLNTIDNSTYLKISERKGILHVEAPSVFLENATLFDLLETQIFNINFDSIESLKIFKGNKKSEKAQLSLKKIGYQWLDSDESILATEKMEDFRVELSGIKSSFTIDKPNELQKNQLANVLKNTEYILSIVDNKSTSTDYFISGIIKNLNDIDMKNEEYFVVTLSNNPLIFLVKKEYLDIFNHKSESLKETPKMPSADSLPAN